MAVPKRRISHVRRRNRRAHHAIGKPNLRPCANCGAYGMPHRICTACGYYKGVQVLIPRAKKAKSDKE
ncbi:50S ribosomal protein L32 [Turneriella parva]|uniref:Large ribosomal subunit protein bL32 n=1 Tax=Turneriella parva (strain ATCC BAA-1111 / DSM 21527 / NCTC 11395 / H) TaxID=869212 RepID=I4BBE6_TURPD|nr:50S ribosomal protein L32 [Turneriella parva]AFM14603.1 LSU ribosomal protein L32P [Turneriella parva DSM 21527]